MESRYVKAVELRPGNMKIVHHAILALDRMGRARAAEELDPDTGYTSSMSLENPQVPEAITLYGLLI